MKILLLSILLGQLIIQINGLGEPILSAAMPSEECLAIQNRGQCINWRRGNIPIVNYPPNYFCPCNPGKGGAIPGDAKVAEDFQSLDTFFDEVLFKGGPEFTNTVAMAFTDNRLLFVVTKEGKVFRIDLETNQYGVWLDLTDEVNNAGDKGILGVEVHPNFKENPHVYMTLAVDPEYGQPDEDMSIPTFIRVIRVTEKNGVADESSRINLIGNSAEDGIPCCSDSHAGGALAMGHDGSLFVTTGDGAHWDFEDGDFGQDKLATDDQCRSLFGDAQDIGSMRAQSLNSLAGKLLRIDPLTGQGICEGSAYEVKNPFCDGDPNSVASRIYAVGFRNPFTMNVKPQASGESGPGVPYIGDVGEGGYEEVNAVTQPGQNFGWPCWEGPFPHPKFRDSAHNWAEGIKRPTSTNGSAINCEYIYHHVETEMPFFYYSRYQETDIPPFPFENGYLGQGFTGNVIAGVAHYSHGNYPPALKDTVWIVDYGKWWIKALSMDENQTYTSAKNLFQLNTPILSLEVEPTTGNICYLTMYKGEVHMIKHFTGNIPPLGKISAKPTAGAAPLVVQFSSDGTFDREGDNITLEWDFGDGNKSTLANPSYVFRESKTYHVTLTVKDSHGNKMSKSMDIVVGNKPPKLQITKPVRVNAESELQFLEIDSGELIPFAVVVEDEAPDKLKYRWEVQIVHNNHIHTDSMVVATPTFEASTVQFGAESHKNERANYRVMLTVTDEKKLHDTASFMLLPLGWQTTFGNVAPVPGFTVNEVLVAGQPVRFSAEPTVDANMDFIFYKWNFGDGFEGTDYITTHIYEKPGVYNVTLKTTDNWGGTAQIEKMLTVVSASGEVPTMMPTVEDSMSYVTTEEFEHTSIEPPEHAIPKDEQPKFQSDAQRDYAPFILFISLLLAYLSA